MTIQITPIPAFNDNYIWAVANHANEVFVVDPGDALPVLDYLVENQGTLAAILITHHHNDHTGGVRDLLAHYDVPIFGPDSAKIPTISHKLTDGASITPIEGVTLTISEIPGHTLDHISYFGDINGKPALFCGDTLFAAGCGRVFEGTYEQMHHSLSLLARFPAETVVYCTHEYTMSNLNFAAAVEPNNSDINQRIEQCQSLREANQPTLPTHLALEFKTNPFLRCEESAVISSVNQHWQESWSNTDDIFAGLRRWKDNF